MTRPYTWRCAGCKHICYGYLGAQIRMVSGKATEVCMGCVNKPAGRMG